MIHFSLPYEPTPEDRIIRTKWARGVVIVYGSVLLLLLAILLAQRLLEEPTRATAVAGSPATHIDARRPAVAGDHGTPTARIVPQVR